MLEWSARPGADAKPQLVRTSDTVLSAKKETLIAALVSVLPRMLYVCGEDPAQHKIPPPHYTTGTLAVDAEEERRGAFVYCLKRLTELRSAGLPCGWGAGLGKVCAGQDCRMVNKYYCAIILL